MSGLWYDAIAMAGKDRGTGKKGAKPDGSKTVGRNRKAFFNYEVLEQVECGLALTGTEVKSLRDGQLNFGDGFARFRDGELFLLNVNIAEYKQGGYSNHDPMRPRKLLLKKKELEKLQRATEEKGTTLIPLSVYFNAKGIAKLALGLCRGKRLYDKRKAIAERDSKRQLAHAKKELSR